MNCAHGQDNNHHHHHNNSGNHAHESNTWPQRYPHVDFFSYVTAAAAATAAITTTIRVYPGPMHTVHTYLPLLRSRLRVRAPGRTTRSTMATVITTTTTWQQVQDRTRPRPSHG